MTYEEKLNIIRPVVMSGGKSSRMGSDKAMLNFGGERMIERTLAVLKGIFPLRPLIVTNAPELYEGLEADVVTDIIKDSGPLAGLHTALSLAGSPYIFVVACDMPMLSAEFIKAMLNEHKGEDVLLPSENGGNLHPLHAVYGQKCLPFIEECLKAKKRRIVSFFDSVNVRKLPVEEFSDLCAEKSCINVNTPDEFRELL